MNELTDQQLREYQEKYGQGEREPERYVELQTVDNGELKNGTGQRSLLKQINAKQKAVVPCYQSLQQPSGNISGSTIYFFDQLELIKKQEQNTEKKLRMISEQNKKLQKQLLTLNNSRIGKGQRDCALPAEPKRAQNQDVESPERPKMNRSNRVVHQGNYKSANQVQTISYLQSNLQRTQFRTNDPLHPISAQP